MTIERRALRPTEVRVDSANPRIFEADVLTYGVIDSYRTIFDSGVFDESLAEHLPKITWGHEWTDPIGRYVDYKNIEARSKDQPARLRLIGELDDFDAVPRAYQASAQLKSGTIDQFSVGFHRNEGGTYEDDDGITHFRSAGLDEVALVLVGAVPGTKLVSVRSARGERRQVPEEYVIDLAKKVAAGEMTKEAAAIAVDLAAGVPTVGGEPAAAGGDGPDNGILDAGSGPPAELLAEADEMLATLGLG
jgi:HK97 family phage prohead protease